MRLEQAKEKYIEACNYLYFLNNVADNIKDVLKYQTRVEILNSILKDSQNTNGIDSQKKAVIKEIAERYEICMNDCKYDIHNENEYFVASDYTLDYEQIQNYVDKNLFNSDIEVNQENITKIINEMEKHKEKYESVKKELENDYYSALGTTKEDVKKEFENLYNEISERINFLEETYGDNSDYHYEHSLVSSVHDDFFKADIFYEKTGIVPSIIEERLLEDKAMAEDEIEETNDEIEI